MGGLDSLGPYSIKAVTINVLFIDFKENLSEWKNQINGLEMLRRGLK